MVEKIPTAYLPQPDPGPYEPGRVCSHARCGCLLSRNNPGPKCAPCQLASMPAEELVAEVIDISPDWAA